MRSEGRAKRLLNGRSVRGRSVCDRNLGGSEGSTLDSQMIGVVTRSSAKRSQPDFRHLTLDSGTPCVLVLRNSYLGLDLLRVRPNYNALFSGYVIS